VLHAPPTRAACPALQIVEVRWQTEHIVTSPEGPEEKWREDSPLI
jgi:hypothetical protein